MICGSSHSFYSCKIMEGGLDKKELFIPEPPSDAQVREVWRYAWKLNL